MCSICMFTLMLFIYVLICLLDFSMISHRLLLCLEPMMEAMENTDLVEALLEPCDT